jgi:superfamily II DNA/RNA helicase
VGDRLIAAKAATLVLVTKSLLPIAVVPAPAAPPFREFLEKNKISCGVINGQVSVNKRSEVIKQFQELPDPHVLIIQPQAASHGLTLTAANTVIWYAPVTSVETYLQANARINRPGQKNAMTIVHIRGSEVENRLYKMLQGNITNHTKIIDLYRQEISESV